MRVTRVFAVAVLTCLVGTGIALSDEQKVKEADVPKPVIEAVKKKYPKAELTGFVKETKKDGKVLYEVNVKAGERKIDVELNPEGKILGEEETIAAADLPKEVKKGLADSKYAKWDVKRVEKVVHEEKEADAVYELVVTKDEEKYEIVFDKTGKLTKEEKKKVKKKGDKKDDDDDDDD